MGLEMPDQKELHDGDSCPECSYGKLVEDSERGELLCGKCGYVAPVKLEEHHGRLKFDDDGKSLDTTSKVMKYGTSSVIAKSNTDYSGLPIKGEIRSMMGRLRIWDSRAASDIYELRAMRKTGPLLEKWCSDLGLNENTLNDAFRIYKKAMTSRLIVGRSGKAMAAASIQISCRVNNIKRTEVQILKITALKPKEFRRAYRILVEKLEIAKALGVVITDPKDFINTIVSKLDLPRQTVLRAYDLLSKVREKGFGEGRNPNVLAAVSIYAACLLDGNGTSQKAIGKAAGVSTVTLRNVLDQFTAVLQIKVKVEEKPKRLAAKEPAIAPLHTQKISERDMAEKPASVDRSLSRGLYNVSTIGSVLSLDQKQIIDARDVYKQIYKGGQWNHNHSFSMAVATIQISRAINNLPQIGPEELKKVGLFSKALTRSEYFFKVFCGCYKNNEPKATEKPLQHIDTNEVRAYLSGLVELTFPSDQVAKRAIEIINRAKRNEVFWSYPKLLASCALYVAAREHGGDISGESISKASHISPSTMVAFAGKIIKELGITIPQSKASETGASEQPKTEALKTLSRPQDCAASTEPTTIKYSKGKTKSA